MKIYTLWGYSPDGDEAPWLVAAVDEYTVEAHDGRPEFYADEMKYGRREMAIEIPDAAVRKLFKAPMVKGEVKS